MTRSKRRFLLGTALTLVLLLGLGTWLYVGYFRATSRLLSHAETLLFRRMTVLKLGEEGTYRFHYVTNRMPGPGADSLEERFGREREDRLKFGHFDTRIESSLGLGMIINPSQWFQNEEIQLEDVRALEQKAFVEQVSALVRASPHRALLVVVHGFREAFPSALRKTAFVSHVLDINAPVLVFDWPGDQGSSLSGYRRARRVAEASGAELARALELIIRDIRPDRLWLLANSMGAQVVVDAFASLYQTADLADAETEIEDVVLTAPDVDHRKFNDRFKQQIKALARNLTVYVSSNDRALLVSRIINRGLRLGESTIRPENASQVEEAFSVAELIEPGSSRIALVDVTAVNRTRNFHNFSLETPEFFDDLFVRLTNAQVPMTRELYAIETSEGARYWVLTRGR